MISGKSFSEQCKWVVDPRYSGRIPFQYSHATHGDWVFVNGDYLSRFLTSIPFRGTKRFVLVLHNTDRSFGQAEFDAVRPHILHVYAVNSVFEHPRVTAIPLGFVDRQLPYLATREPSAGDRLYGVYVNFTAGTNTTKRAECLTAVQGDPRLVVRTNLTVPEYYDDLCKSTFVLCPEGTGIDTHRVYESLLCGATPVVLRNALAPLYATLPVCIVESWTDPFYAPTDRSFSPSVEAYLRR